MGSTGWGVRDGGYGIGTGYAIDRDGICNDRDSIWVKSCRKYILGLEVAKNCGK